jgi:hypothetical protein
MCDLLSLANQESGLRLYRGASFHYFFLGVAPDDQKSLWKGARQYGSYPAIHFKGIELLGQVAS